MRRTAAYRRLEEILTKRRDGLRRVLNHDLMGLRNGVGIDIGDEVDIAVDDEFNHVSSQLVESESRELEQVEDALARIRKGLYGQCEGCDEEIPLARLQALPYARRCVKCQRVSENVKSDSNRRIDWPEVRDMMDEPPYNSIADHVVDVR